MKLISLATLSVSLYSTPILAQTSTVVEYYNTNIKHYFIAADAAEVAAIDSGAAGPGWTKTGETFVVWRSASTAPAGSKPVCRFYGKGPNSHFFTAVVEECAFLKSLNPNNVLNDTAWLLENPAFFYVPNASSATNGTCAAGQTPVSRYYNNRGTNTGVNDANHRFVVSATVAASMAAQGWKNEGTVFCVQPSTSTTPPPPTPNTGGDECLPTLAVGDSFTLKYTEVASGSSFTVNQVVIAGETFRGQSANYVLATVDAAGKIISKTYYQDSATERRLLGTLSVADGAQTYFNPQYVIPKNMTAGTTYQHDHTEFTTTDATFMQRKKGTLTLVGRESVTVPAGSFSNVCKINSAGTVTGGNSTTSVNATYTGVSWSGAGIDSIKATARTTVSAFGFSLDTDSLVELVKAKVGTKTYP